MAKPKKDIFCVSCKKKIEKGEKYENIRWREEDGSKGIDYWKGNNYCISCYEKRERERKEVREKIKEQREKAQEIAKQEALDKFETLSNECFQKTFELGLKVDVENEELSVDDYKKIKGLLKKLNQAEKKKELDDLLIKEEIKKLQNSLKELEEHTSPRTQDQASNDKSRIRKAHKKCRHEQIEPYEDEPNNYYCSYCWDDESPEFLQVLKRKGINPQPKNNNNDDSQKRDNQKQQLQQDITNLENKPNRTSEEEEDLKKKRKQLVDLENKNQSEPENKKSFNYTPWIIGGGCLLLAIIIFLVWNSQRKKTA